MMLGLQVKTLQELLPVYGGKTIDNVLAQLKERIKLDNETRKTQIGSTPK